MDNATGKPPADRRPSRYTPLRDLRSVPSPGRRTAGEAWIPATPRGCGRGSAPYRRTPHEDAPEHLTGRDANAGKQSPDQGHATAELRHDGNASRPPPVTLRSVRTSATCRRSSELSKLRCAPRQAGCGRGSAPYRRTPPKADAPGTSYLAGTPTAGRSKTQVRDTPRLKQGTPCEAQLRPPPNGLRARTTTQGTGPPRAQRPKAHGPRFRPLSLLHTAPTPVMRQEGVKKTARNDPTAPGESWPHSKMACQAARRSAGDPGAAQHTTNAAGTGPSDPTAD